MPIYKTKNEAFFKKWTPEMAYVLGFFTADGTIDSLSLYNFMYKNMDNFLFLSRKKKIFEKYFKIV